MKKLLIIGAGGHGKVVADTALESEKWDKICFLDDNNVDCGPYEMLGNTSQLPQFIAEFSVIVALGDNKKRGQILSWAGELGCEFGTVIHPRAFVSKSSEIALGVVVFAHAVINANSKVGFGCIINTGAIVEHDCILDDCVHVSPNVAMAGGVKVGGYTWIGIGSSIIENVNIGSNAIVGAGAVVINDVPSNVIVVGNPAKVIKIKLVK